MLMCPGPSTLPLSKFPFWLLMMKCKNNTRSCVPTCLPEYSAIMANSRILQPLQLSAAPLPSGSYRLFNKISRRGFWLFRYHTGAETKSNYFYFPFPFHKKPRWCRLWKQAVQLSALEKRIYVTWWNTVQSMSYCFKHIVSSWVNTLYNYSTIDLNCCVHITLCIQTKNSLLTN